MAINQEKIQALTQLMGLMGNPMQELQGLAGLQQGIENTAQGRAAARNELKSLEIQAAESKNRADNLALASKQQKANVALKMKELQALEKDTNVRNTIGKRANDLAQQKNELIAEGNRGQQAFYQDQLDDNAFRSDFEKLFQLATDMNVPENDKMQAFVELFDMMGLDFQGGAASSPAVSEDMSSEQRKQQMRQAMSSGLGGGVYAPTQN